MVTSITGQGLAAYKAPDDALSSESKNAVQNKVIDEELSDVKNAISQKAPLIINTASGAIASFTDGADDMPVKQIVAQINPVQAAGTPSPENPLPISGYTGANIKDAGKNLLKTAGLTYAEPSNTSFSNTTKRTYQLNSYTTKLSANNNYNTAATITNISITDNSVTFTSSSTGYGVSIPTIGLKAEETYTFSVASTTTKLFASFYAADGTFISSLQATGAQPAKVTFTVPKGTYYTCLGFNVLTNVSTVSATNIQLELGESVSAYEAYKPIQTIPITFPDAAGTVYGASLTVNEDGSGTLVVTDGNIASYNGETLSSTWISSMDVYAEGTTPTIGAQVVYKLAEPVAYNLTALQVFETLYGANNIWCDTGDISVDYPADTKLYIDGLTAPDEDMIANANIASGKYFVVNNQLYISTAAIAAGASIVPGTNCTATNLAEALNALNT